MDMSLERRASGCYLDRYDDHSLCSMEILLSWLSTPYNYRRWCLLPDKLPLCDEVLKEMYLDRIYHRNHREIITMVKQLQASYRIARRYPMRMIVTLMKTNPSDGMWMAEQEVIRQCGHWLLLDETMGEEPPLQ
ncbi:hypothetical protein PGTUg99_023997 [Puccinia graminis f. sp. tritici]|uniref:Uncharacterized protein n=1 Tax=Puccinia graminis f. sp. tritici TaxID=56615 RepID=A0A5B0R9Q9_PUCGR|nr:hypothetical protein PGTUg99_023997 [Puccinia graminis f. sp. tritici]